MPSRPCVCVCFHRRKHGFCWPLLPCDSAECSPDAAWALLQVHHKKMLEERLAEVEQALRIFSQRRVLVKSDDAG